MKYLFSFLLTLCFYSTVLVEPVFAQENTDLVIETTAITDLQDQYLQHIQSYRNQEEVFLLAKAQYQKLGTLASQEEIVKEARQLLLIRADVYSVYVDILDEQLNQATGIPLEKKNSQRVNLSLLKDKIAIHKTTLQTKTDRFALDNEVIKFKPTIEEIKRQAATTLGMMKLGRVQIAFDKLNLVTEEIRNYVTASDLTAPVRAEKTRGFVEIDRVKTDVETQFKLVSDKFYSQSNRSLQTYNQLTSELNRPYANLNQIVEYLEEIKK